MKLTKITVSSGRTWPHPTETFATFRSQVTLEATVKSDASAGAAVKILQREADRLVDEHRAQVDSALMATDVAMDAAKRKTESTASQLAAKHQKGKL